MDGEISTPTFATKLRAMTAARVALGRSGSGWPTSATLTFALDHARAREAVWSAMDLPALRHAFEEWPQATAGSAASSRAVYIRRPDLGRRLAPETDLSALPKGRVVIVVADGLSATAVNTNAAVVVQHLQALLPEAAPIVLVERGRVAIGDEIGAATEAEAVVVLIGERPGLSASDSLGAYVTWKPEPGLPDSRRNCISNIRNGGLSPNDAAKQIASLLRLMKRTGTSGVQLASEKMSPLKTVGGSG
ncbi:ethanolamine ammonia-lyase subunit EutC [Limimaricola variabilis]